MKARRTWLCQIAGYKSAARHAEGRARQCRDRGGFDEAESWTAQAVKWYQAAAELLVRGPPPDL